MDIEQLRLVMETLAQMGAHGKEAFIWWLFFDKALPSIVWLILLPCVLITASRVISRMSENEQRLRNIRDILGIGCAGYVSIHEFNDIVKELKKIKNAN